MKTKILAASLAALMMMTSCASSEQFFGTATGASLGGLFGSAIGGVSGGRRGSAAGTVVGMIVGGAIGAAATAPKTDDYRTSDYYRDRDHSRNDYRPYNSYNPYADIEIEEVRFVDSNDSRSIEAEEHARLVFNVRNNGRDYVYDIAPVITVSGTKEIYLSPTAIISELAPGRAVRYSADVVATRKLKNGTAHFAISFSDGDALYTVRSFDIDTYDRKHTYQPGAIR